MSPRTTVLLSLTLAFGGPAEAVEAKLTVGETPPPFSLVQTTGETVTLDGLAGKVVILDFWASWCAPCQQELPLLVALSQAHADQGLVVLAVNIDERPKNRDRFLKRMPLALPVLDDSAHTVVSSYDITSLPTSVVIGRDGRVHSVHSGFTQEDFERLKAEVASLL